MAFRVCQAFSECYPFCYIIFPKPTHGEGLIPYRTAAECIDWSLPCKSIFAREKPLAENTKRRIARGLDKFTIKSDKPFIINYKFVNPPESTDEPLSTITAVGNHYAAIPHISKFFGGIVGSEVTAPLATVTAVDHNAVVAPKITPYIMSNNTNNVGASADSPLPTITTGNRNFLTTASLIQYHSEQSSSEVRGQELNVPIMTVDASPRYALTAAHVVKYYKGDNYSSVNEPLHTVTVKERHMLVESHLCILRRNQDCKELTEPFLTECTSAGHFAEIRTVISTYKNGDDLGYWAEIRKLLNTYCGYALADNEILLLEINKELFFISDIGLRIHISKLNIKAVVKIIVQIAELLKDCLLILVSRQLIIDVVEADSLGIIIIGHLTHAVFKHLLVRYGFLRGIRVLVIVFDLCYFLVRPLFFFLCKRLLRRGISGSCAFSFCRSLRGLR